MVVGLAAEEEKTYFSFAIYLAVLRMLMKLLSFKRKSKNKMQAEQVPDTNLSLVDVSDLLI